MAIVAQAMRERGLKWSLKEQSTLEWTIEDVGREVNAWDPEPIRPSSLVRASKRTGNSSAFERFSRQLGRRPSPLEWRRYQERLGVVFRPTKLPSSGTGTP